jgi:hypothetical protein
MNLTPIERAFFTSLSRTLELQWSDDPIDYFHLMDVAGSAKVLSEAWEGRNTELAIASCGVMFEQTLRFSYKYGLGNGLNFTIFHYIEKLDDKLSRDDLYCRLMNASGIAQYVDNTRQGFAQCLVLSILLRARLYQYPL